MTRHLTRRDAIKGGPAALVALAAAGTVTAAEPPLDPEALQVAELFMRLNDGGRACLHALALSFQGIEPDPRLMARMREGAAS